MEKQIVNMSLDQLKELVSYLENQTQFHSMQPFVGVSIETLPNGNPELVFQQPCYYSECSSNYLRYSNRG